MTRPILEPGQFVPDGSGQWASIPPGTDLGRQMLWVLHERERADKARRAAEHQAEVDKQRDRALTKTKDRK